MTTVDLTENEQIASLKADLAQRDLQMEALTQRVKELAGFQSETAAARDQIALLGPALVQAQAQLATLTQTNAELARFKKDTTDAGLADLGRVQALKDLVDAAKKVAQF